MSDPRFSRFGPKPKPPLQRVLERIEIDPDRGCWIWRGALADGYGRIGLVNPRRSVPVHRLVYEELVGPVPAGLQMDHLCRVRACCNPDHLEPVTQSENNRRIPPLTHCRRGHPLDEENTSVRPDGRRFCQLCQTTLQRERRAARRVGAR